MILRQLSISFENTRCVQPKFVVDRTFAEAVVEMLSYGANVGFCGPHYPRFTPNAATAREHADMLVKSIAKQILLEHAVGPFLQPPLPNFVTSSLGVLPKKSGGHKVVMNLSCLKGNNINDSMDRESCSSAFGKFDDAIKVITETGGCAELAKQDIKHAFRLVPVRPNDWHLLGYQFEAMFFFDVVLLFGSCHHSFFAWFRKPWEWILKLQTCSTNVHHYI